MYGSQIDILNCIKIYFISTVSSDPSHWSSSMQKQKVPTYNTVTSEMQITNKQQTHSFWVTPIPMILEVTDKVQIIYPWLFQDSFTSAPLFLTSQFFSLYILRTLSVFYPFIAVWKTENSPISYPLLYITTKEKKLNGAIGQFLLQCWTASQFHSIYSFIPTYNCKYIYTILK